MNVRESGHGRYTTGYYWFPPFIIIGKLCSRFSLEYFHSSSERILAIRAPQGRSIFHPVAATGNNALLDIPLANGADVSVRDEDGEIPLHIALSKGKEAMAVKLIDADNRLLIEADLLLVEVRNAERERETSR